MSGDVSINISSDSALLLDKYAVFLSQTGGNEDLAKAMLRKWVEECNEWVIVQEEPK